MNNDIILIAAIGKNNELGKQGDLIWDIPGDLKRFKDITKGHPIIMGYKTYVSIGSKSLPHRTNIVMALEEDVEGDAYVARSIDDAIALANNADGSDKVFIIGGGQIYNLFLPHATVLNLTIVDEVCADADTFFPKFDMEDFEEISRDEKHEEGLRFAFVELRKK